MKYCNKILVLPEGSFPAKVQVFESSDKLEIKEMVTLWLNLCEKLKNFNARGVNIPEGISESFFCLMMQGFEGEIVRTNNCKIPANTSFDCYNTITKKEYKLSHVAFYLIYLLLVQNLFMMRYTYWI